MRTPVLLTSMAFARRAHTANACFVDIFNRRSLSNEATNFGTDQVQFHARSELVCWSYMLAYHDSVRTYVSYMYQMYSLIPCIYTCPSVYIHLLSHACK